MVVFGSLDCFLSAGPATLAEGSTGLLRCMASHGCEPSDEEAVLRRGQCLRDWLPGDCLTTESPPRHSCIGVRRDLQGSLAQRCATSPMIRGARPKSTPATLRRPQLHAHTSTTGVSTNLKPRSARHAHRWLKIVNLHWLRDKKRAWKTFMSFESVSTHTHTLLMAEILLGVIVTPL